jgi:hypothetical protein
MIGHSSLAKADSAIMAALTALSQNFVPLLVTRFTAKRL